VWVSDLRLSHFRNHSSTALQLTPGITTFVGPNGQGKTNIVESLVYLSQLSSHRTSSDETLVQQGNPEAELRATVRHDGRQVELGLIIRSSGSNRSTVNGQPSSLADMSSWLKVVIFSPEDMALVRGEPSIRRRLLDIALIGLFPRYRAVLSEYDRVVRQKNSLLKTLRHHRGSNTEMATLAVWNDALARLGADISWGRLELVELWNPLTDHAYQAVAPENRLQISLDWSDSNWADSVRPSSMHDVVDRYRLSLDRAQLDEHDRGMSLVGPHRDDLAISLNDLPARTHASQGEAWSAALSLRMGLAELFKSSSLSGDPVIILDDVFSELDGNRREALARTVSKYEQVLITAAVTDDVPSQLSGQRYLVSQGQVSDE
jgi:DNA replication and repair protein RecF